MKIRDHIPQRTKSTQAHGERIVSLHFERVVPLASLWHRLHHPGKTEYSAASKESFCRQVETVKIHALIVYFTAAVDHIYYNSDSKLQHGEFLEVLVTTANPKSYSERFRVKWLGLQCETGILHAISWLWIGAAMVILWEKLPSFLDILLHR